MNITTSSRKISKCGGSVFVLKKLKQFGIDRLINNSLGTRKKQCRYSYADVLISWILTTYCTGIRLNKISDLKENLNIIPDLKIPSHDTLGRAMKKLATEMNEKENISGRGSEKKLFINRYCENEALNKLLVQISKEVGALKEGKLYTLHIDATFIETACATLETTTSDARAQLQKKQNGLRKLKAAKKGGKVKTKLKGKGKTPNDVKKKKRDAKKYGYNPMVCLIDELPVYISMRNGDSNAEFNLRDCLEKCLDLLEENNIKVGRVISDSAGYKKEVVDMLNYRNIKFNINTPVNRNFKAMNKLIKKCQNWKQVQIKTAFNVRDCEIGEVNYTLHNSYYESRLIVLREFTTNKKIRIENSEDKKYRIDMEDKMERLKLNGRIKGEQRARQQGKWKPFGRDYKIKIIVTNDFDMTPEEILYEYNKRGDAERKFSFMKNDFGWKYPPFQKMTENAVFLIATAIANNVFRGLVQQIIEFVPQLRLNGRLEHFKSVIINVICELTRRNVYKFYSMSVNFEKIM